jgi:hypothetical protein
MSGELQNMNIAIRSSSQQRALVRQAFSINEKDIDAHPDVITNNVSAGWARNTDLVWSQANRIVNNIIETVINGGVYSEEKIAELVGHYSLRWPIPSQFLPVIQDFICNLCKPVALPNQESQMFLNHQLSLRNHQKCFVVFHEGYNKYYYDQLPQKILALRETILFWIYSSQREFYSQGRNRKHLRPQTLRVLRFLSSMQNAGQTISMAEIYRSVWQANPPDDSSSMITSIGVEISALNRFADPVPFERSVGANAFIIRSGDAYKIREDLTGQCCIINKIEQETSNAKAV